MRPFRPVGPQTPGLEQLRASRAAQRLRMIGDSGSPLIVPVEPCMATLVPVMHTAPITRPGAQSAQASSSICAGVGAANGLSGTKISTHEFCVLLPWVPGSTSGADPGCAAATPLNPALR